MFAIIFSSIFLLFANESTAMKAGSMCCEEIRSLLENKTVAHQTVCLRAENKLKKNCCKNIEIEIEKHRHAYMTLCPEDKPVTTVATPSKASPVIQCDIPLGVGNGSIPDVAMTSSTILTASSLPHFGRLRSQYGGCAWIPAGTADRNSSWLQVDLGTLVNTSAVATQGSCSGDQWTTSYVIIYSGNGVNWTNYEEQGAIKVFKGNNDSTSIVTNYFKSPIATRFVRISPRSWHKNAALRIELFTDCHSSISVPTPQSPQSCLDHLKNGLKTNGYYNIYHASSSLVTVYCDMTSESGKAWTLVASFATKNKNMAEFRTTPLYKDSPVDESFPNWNRYRMSLTTIIDLSAQSTHWRATCSFPTHGVDYTDYVRGKFTDFDVIHFRGSNTCKTVEYVNIRGHHCNECSLPWWQASIYFLHTDSTYTTCDFDPTQGRVYREDNFGFYRNINRKFRCTSDPNSTTNWWFGGNVA